MLDDVDRLLRRLLLDEVLTGPGVAPTDEQVGFGPPDKDWRAAGGDRDRLNVYLVDLRERTELRPAELGGIAAGGGSELQSWVDAHYLVTAWSAAQQPSTGRLAEHALLYRVMRTFLARSVLGVADVFRSGPVPAELVTMGDAEVLVEAVPGEGFAKLAEFWSAMGSEEVWRPAVYLVITVPVLVPPAPGDGAAVLTAVLAVNGEESLQIAGRVLVAAGGGAVLPEPHAWVQLETPGGGVVQSRRADADGRWSMDGLARGSYLLRCRAAGHDEPAPLPIEVPSPEGYDLTVG